MSETTIEVCLKVNGRTITRRIAPRTLLVDFLREELSMKGTHVGCEVGACGCCNVILNGKTTRSCLTFAAQADGGELTTVEGLGTVTNLHPLQEAFREAHALQCGYCTPGMLMTGIEFLETNRNAAPTRDEVIEALSGNLCRCTGYEPIVDAVLLAARKMFGGRSEA